MTARLPTELQCLAARMAAASSALTQALAKLEPQMLAAVSWEPSQASQLTAAVEAFNREALHTARGLEFDAVSFSLLADDFAADGRRAYDLSMQLVDALRLGGLAQPSTMAPVDALQQAIAAQFPGESIPGAE